jgi:hypothetical protein
MQLPGTEPTVTTGVEAVKREPPSLISKLPVDVPQKQSVKLQYEVKQSGDIYQIKHISGGQLELDYPVENANRLDYLAPIESQFAAANTGSQFDSDLIDTAILSAMPYCLAQEDVALPDDPIPAARFKTLIFGQARGMQYRTDLLHYLDNHPETAQSLGLGSIGRTQLPSESSLSRTATEWGIDDQPVQDAIRRLRHTLLRNGILPDRYVDIGLEADKPIPYRSQLSDQLRYQGLVNYADLLLEKIEGVSLNRSMGVKYSPREILATIAQMALHDSPTKGYQLAQWHYESDLATYRRIQQIVSEKFGPGGVMLGKSRVETLDRELHEAIFEFADDMGMFNRPINIALDPTWVSVDSAEDTPGAIKNPTMRAGSNGGYTYPMAVVYAPISLSLGVKWIPDKSEYPNSFRKLLSRINEFGEIGWILADREFDGADMIKLARTAADRRWTIRLRKHHEVLTPTVRQSLERTGKAEVTIGGCNVNVFSKGFDDGYYQVDKNENMILISDMPEADMNLSAIVETYTQRWAVETFIRQIKHKFSPKIKRESAILNEFMFSIASAFYNIWAIMRQSVSPVYALPLRPKYYDVLMAIVQSTFDDRRQFRSHI